MQSAPAAIPATIEVSFPAGFTQAVATFVPSPRIATFPAISSDRPACSANHRNQPGTPDPGHRRPAWPATRREIVALQVPSVTGLIRNFDAPDSLPVQKALSFFTPRRTATSPRIHVKSSGNSTAPAQDWGLDLHRTYPEFSRCLETLTPHSVSVDGAAGAGVLTSDVGAAGHRPPAGRQSDGRLTGATFSRGDL